MRPLLRLLLLIACLFGTAWLRPATLLAAGAGRQDDPHTRPAVHETALPTAAATLPSVPDVPPPSLEDTSPGGAETLLPTALEPPYEGSPRPLLRVPLSPSVGTPSLHRHAVLSVYRC